MKKFDTIFYSDIIFKNLYYKNTSLYYILNNISYLVKFNEDGKVTLYITE